MTLRGRFDERTSEWPLEEGQAANGEKGPEGYRGIRGMGVVLLLGVILGVFFFIAARTAGFRELIADRWSETLGVRPHIGSSRLSFNGDLVFHGVHVGISEGGSAILQIPEVRFRWRPRIGTQRILVRPVLRLDGRGGAFFEGLRGLEKAEHWEEIEESLSGSIPSGRWEVREGAIESMDMGGRVRWRVDKIRGVACRLDIPAHDAIYWKLDSVVGTGLRAIPRVFPREWLWMDGRIIRLAGVERRPEEDDRHD